jgi:hypothetical protein
MTSTEPVLLPSEVWRLILQFKSDALHAAATKIQAVARGTRPREEWAFRNSGKPQDFFWFWRWERRSYLLSAYLLSA